MTHSEPINTPGAIPVTHHKVDPSGLMPSLENFTKVLNPSSLYEQNRKILWGELEHTIEHYKKQSFDLYTNWKTFQNPNNTSVTFQTILTSKKIHIDEVRFSYHIEAHLNFDKTADSLLFSVIFVISCRSLTLYNNIGNCLNLDEAKLLADEHFLQQFNIEFK